MPRNVKRVTLVTLGAAEQGLGRFEVVLADRTRLHGSKGHHTPRSEAPRLPETTVFGETTANGGSAHQTQKGSSCCARRVTRGVRSRFTPLPTAENAAGQGALPGRALDQGPSQDRAEHGPRETRVTRESVEAVAASSSAASTDGSRVSTDPQGARVRESVADVDKTHLPPGARPAERQAANRGVTFCGGLLGDDEGPIRSGQKGARLERANRLVSAREPAFTARCGIESTEGVLVRVVSSP